MNNLRGPDWSNGGVGLFSQISLSRNVRGYPYPNAMTDSQAFDLNDRVREAVANRLGPAYIHLKARDLTDLEILQEKHIIEEDLVDNRSISSFHINYNEGVNIMVNGSDHIKLQLTGSELKLKEDYDKALVIVTDLAEDLDFSYHSQYGYLTSSPTRLGTGLEISIYLHLPGIFYSGHINKMSHDLMGYGISLEGNYISNSQYTGNIFKISNAKSLGVTEEEIVYKMVSIVKYIEEAEEEIIFGFRDKYPLYFEDGVARSLGILKYSKQISQREAMATLSNLRTGIWTEDYTDLSMDQVNELFLKIQKNSILKYIKDMNLNMTENQARSYLINEFFEEADIDA